MKKVMFYDDEREMGNSIIVTLKYGWKFTDDTHVMGFDTGKEAISAIHNAVKCNCKDCKNKG